VTGNLAAQRKKFKEAIQNFNEICFGEDAFDDQKTAMEEGMLKYSGPDIDRVITSLYTINGMLFLFMPDVNELSDREMAKKYVPRNLNTQMKIEYIKMAGDQL
jgi:hypothetical protein